MTNNVNIVGCLTRLLPLSRPDGLPVYVARVPAAPFCETPIDVSRAGVRRGERPTIGRKGIVKPVVAEIGRRDLMRVIRWVGELLVLIAVIIAAAWAFGAVWFDGPFGAGNRIAAALLATTFVVVLLFVRPFWRKLGIFVVLFAGVLIWWLTLSPTNDSDWQPDVAQKAWADIQGDEVTLHNVRSCDYRTDTDYTPHWETRTVRLSQITGIDLAIDYWGSPWIAHPIVSFQFADAPPLCFSIETRKKLGQTYSTIGGLYRQFELIYIVADERDVIRLRTNYRKEDIYLYRTTISPAHARERFLEYIHSLNALRNKPRWYNAITTNCTTSIRTQHPP